MEVGDTNDDTGLNKEDLFNLGFLGGPLEQLIEERKRPELVEYYRGLDEEARLSLGFKYAPENDFDALMIELAQGFASQRSDSGERAIFGEVTVWDDYCPLARMIHIGVLDERRYTRPPAEWNWEDFLEASQAGIAAIKNPMIKRSKAFVDAEIVKKDLAALRASDADKTLVRDSLGKRLTGDHYVFSSLYYSYFRSLNKVRVDAVKSSKGVGYQLKMPDGSTHAVVPNPVTGAPGYILNAGKFQNAISKVAGAQTKITVIPGDFAVDELICFILQNMSFKYDTKEGLIITTAETFGAKSVFSSSQAKIFEQVRKWAAQIDIPYNLASMNNIPTLLHWMIYRAEEKGDPIFQSLASFSKTYALRHQKALSAALLKWLPYKTALQFINDVTDKKVRPVAGLADACARVAERRELHNKNAQYNAMFETLDASVHGRQDPIKCPAGKFVPPLEWMKLRMLEPGKVDVYAFASGVMLPAIAEVFPNATVTGYDATKRKKTQANVIPGWTALSGWIGEGDLMVDNSYGEGQEFKTMNKFKVAKLIERHAAGKPYAGGMLKFYCGTDVSMVTKATKYELPYDIQDIALYYDEFQLFATGKAHAPEFIVTFFGPRAKPHENLMGVIADIQACLTVPLLCKVAMLDMANLFREFTYTRGISMAIGPYFGKYAGSIWNDAIALTGFYAVKPVSLGEITELFHVGKKLARVDDIDEYNFAASFHNYETAMNSVRDMCSFQDLRLSDDVMVDDASEEEEDDAMRVDRYKRARSEPEKKEKELEHKRPGNL